MFGYKKNKQHIVHPLGKTSAVDPCRQDALVSKLRDGSITKEEREELASGLIKFVISLAACYYGDSDELVAEGLFGLTRALELAPKKLKDNNIIPYLARWVHKYCFLVAGPRRAVVGPSRETKLKPGSHIPAIVYDIGEVVISEDQADQMLDLIRRSAETEFERNLLLLKMDGMSDKNAAYILNCSPSWVGQVKRQMFDRFKELKEREL